MLCDAVKYAKATGQTQIREYFQYDEINKTKPKTDVYCKPISRRNSNTPGNKCIDEDGFRYVDYEISGFDDLF